MVIDVRLRVQKQIIVLEFRKKFCCLIHREYIVFIILNDSVAQRQFYLKHSNQND